MPTVETVARRVLLHASLPDLLQALDWVQTAYNRLADLGEWSWLRAERDHLTDVQKIDGTVSLTRGSLDVIGTGTSFAITDVGRQILFGGSAPVYSVAAVPDATTLTLDRAYGGVTSASSSYRIIDAYVTMPANFGRFMGVLDPIRQRQLWTDVTGEEVNIWDAGRRRIAEPYALASRQLSSLAGETNRPQFELWPYQPGAAVYYMAYYLRPEEFTLESPLPGLLNSRPDVLQTGALAACAQWPGTEERKNPYFNMTLASKLQEQFQADVVQLSLRDDDIFLTSWKPVSWINSSPYYAFPERQYDWSGTLIGPGY